MAVHELQVTVRERGGIGVIDLVGDVNGSAEAALNEGYAEAVRGGAASVALNFEAADYINSTGIALIVGLLAQARKSGIEVKAFGLSEHYREIFELTRLDEAVGIHDSQDEALAAAGASGPRP